MAFTEQAERVSSPEGAGHKADTTHLTENLQRAGYESQRVTCSPSENNFVNGVRRDMQAFVDRESLSPEQRRDAEKYIDDLVPKCGKDDGGGEVRAKQIEAKYKQDASMTKLLKNMKDSATLSFD